MRPKNDESSSEITKKKVTCHIYCELQELPKNKKGEKEPNKTHRFKPSLKRFVLMGMGMALWVLSLKSVAFLC